MTLLPLASPPPPTADRPGLSAVVPAVPAPRAATATLPLPHPFEAPTAAERVLAAARPDDRDAIVWLSEHIATLHRSSTRPPHGTPGPQPPCAISRPALLGRLAYRLSAAIDRTWDILDCAPSAPSRPSSA